MDTRLMFTATTLAFFSIIFSLDPLHFFSRSPPSLVRDKLRDSEIIACPVGPESLAFDPNGEGPYVGVADGRILKWQGRDGGWANFSFTSPQRMKELCDGPHAFGLEHVCGRPLGLRFNRNTGELYIADAYFGFMVVGPGGGLATSLSTQAEGEPFGFTNDMDIDEEDSVIYFTDTSTRFQRRQFISAILTGDRSGRLMKYDIATGEVKVLLRGLSFANGVAISTDRSFLLVAESTTCRILRFWLSGPDAGSSDVFVELPGFPDNIRRNSKGEFWVALHSRRSSMAKLAGYNAWFWKLTLKLPFKFKRLHKLFVGWKPHAVAMRLSEKGEILEVLEDGKGKTLRYISEVEERNGNLWIGSVMMPFVGIYKL